MRCMEVAAMGTISFVLVAIAMVHDQWAGKRARRSQYYYINFCQKTSASPAFIPAPPTHSTLPLTIQNQTLI